MIGPKIHDYRSCPNCKGSGVDPRPVLPDYGGLAGFIPGEVMAEKANMQISGQKFDPDLLEKMCRDIDVSVNNAHERHLERLASATLRGVTIIADHRIRDGSLAILVSPEDYRRIKAATKE